MTVINFIDSVAIGKAHDTKDGYLVSTSRIARTGVQEYRAYEIGLIGDHVVKVNRPESEVFSKDTFASLSRIPITVNHPNEPVTADNWSDYAVGEVGDSVLRDGDYIVVNPMVKDARGVEAATTSHKEFSAGYTAVLIKADDEAPYDYEQTQIRYNHLALVERGRAGSKARVADNWGAGPVTTKEAETMADTINVVIGDSVVSVSAQDAAIINKLLSDHKAELDVKDAAIDAANARVTEAEAKILSDEEMEAAVKAFADKQMRRKAVEDKHGADFMEGKSDAYLDAAYDLLPKESKPDLIADAVKNKVAVEDASVIDWGKTASAAGVAKQGI